eukprot:snap_masked-scaffold_13-processed-gene-6.17-mRNA-1 protein AED:1.00 eAED:1.00 QI:0/0/0/0/1/1/2/0/69
MHITSQESRRLNISSFSLYNSLGKGEKQQRGLKKSYAALLKITAVLRVNPDGDSGDLHEFSEESGIMFE